MRGKVGFGLLLVFEVSFAAFVAFAARSSVDSDETIFDHVTCGLILTFTILTTPIDDLCYL